MSFFKRVTSKVASSPWAILIWFVSVWMLANSIQLWIEDWGTTKAFYESLPTRKINAESVTFAFASIIQIAPLYLGYVFADSYDRKAGTTNWVYGLLALGIMLIDMLTDAFFKSEGLGFGVFMIAVGESLIVYTLGVEFLLVTSIGVLFNLTKPAFTQTIAMFRGIVTTIGDIADGGDGGSKNSPPPQAQKPPQGGQTPFNPFTSGGGGKPNQPKMGFTSKPAPANGGREHSQFRGGNGGKQSGNSSPSGFPAFGKTFTAPPDGDIGPVWKEEFDEQV